MGTVPDWLALAARVARENAAFSKAVRAVDPNAQLIATGQAPARLRSVRCRGRGRVFATPAYYAFRMYSTADAARLVKADTNSGVYSVRKGTRDVAEIAGVPYLDVVAALNAKKDVLTLFCVNRSFTEDLPTSIHLDGFGASPTARVQVLKAQSIYEKNDEANTQHIIPVTSSLDVHSPGITYTFPRSSVTVITLHKQ